MARLTRRRFVAAAAGTTAVPSLLAGRVFGANDAIRVGVAGVRGRGQLHMAMVSKIPGFRLVALCDPDAAVLGSLADNVRKKNPAVQTFQDVREMLDRKDIDLSSGLCHTGMISHRIGQGMNDGEIRERIQGNRLLTERFESMKEHLGRNEIDLNKTRVSLGPWLSMAPKTERFLDNSQANALLTRDYRKPFVVPEIG